MAYQANVVNVMIASPGDVAAERQAIESIIHNWNSVNAEERQTVLMPIKWETHSTPEMGDRAQAIINRQVLDKCDLLVAVFWTRLGSPTGESPSGTVEEIRKHLQAGKPAMIYFSRKPVDPESIDAKQYESLKAFRAECEKRGLIARYENPQEFRDAFSRHLAQIVRDQFAAGVSVDDQAAESPVPAQLTLSDEAKRLLITAANAGGTILRIRTFGETIIQAGNTAMAEDNSPRTAAKWEAAIRQLLNEGLVEARGQKGEVFAVTHAGFALADVLRPLDEPGAPPRA